MRTALCTLWLLHVITLSAWAHCPLDCQKFSQDHAAITEWHSLKDFCTFETVCRYNLSINGHHTALLALRALIGSLCSLLQPVLHVINNCWLDVLWTKISDTKALTTNLKEDKTIHTLSLTFFHFKQTLLKASLFSSHCFLSFFPFRVMRWLLLAAESDKLLPPLLKIVICSHLSSIAEMFTEKNPESKINILSQFHTPNLPKLCHDET